jgi:HTH-like domain
VADTITEIHQRSSGTYGRRRVRAALLTDYDMNVNLLLSTRSCLNKVGTVCRTQGGESPN